MSDASSQGASPRGAQEDASPRGASRATAQEEHISVWEWIAGAAGAVLVLAALVFLLREAQQPTTPPDISVRLDSVQVARNVYIVHFTAHNEGAAPAAEVTIEGTAAGPADTLRSTTTLSYLPGQSQRSGGLFFPVDPRTGSLRMRALGYEVP